MTCCRSYSFNPLYTGHQLYGNNSNNRFFGGFNPLYTGHQLSSGNNRITFYMVSIPYTRVTNFIPLNVGLVRFLFQSPIHGSPTIIIKEVITHEKIVSIPYTRVTNCICLKLSTLSPSSFNPLYTGHQQ